MSDPIPIRDASEPPNEHVIDALERMLVLARSGELRGVVILANMPRESYSEWAGRWDGPSAVWSLECWKHKLLHATQTGLR